MIVRIVRMTFQPDKVGDFLKVFDEVKAGIVQFEGCEKVQLLKEENKDNVFFTHSLWRDVDALEVYRHSDFFKNTWGRTKVLFADKPEAWSLRAV